MESFEQGKKAFAANQIDEAIKFFTEAIEKKAKVDIAYSNRAACYLAQAKNFEAGGAIEILTKAVDDATAAIKANKKNVKAYVRQGAAYLQLKKYPQAKKSFEAGLNIDPLDKQLHDGLATATKLTSSQKQNKKKAQEPIKTEDIVVGIDLGTTYSCITYYHNGQVTIIPNDRGDMTTPSYVSFNKQGGRTCGMGAKLEAPRNPRKTIFDVKRFIGSNFSDSGVQQDISRYPYKVVEKVVDVKQEDGTVKQVKTDQPLVAVEVSGENGTKEEKLFAPEEISAMVLGYLKKQAENYLGGPVTKAVITVPAYFNDAQRAATKLAGELAGLQVLRMINEPTAAALAYGLDKKSINIQDDKAANVLIFDLGGGTFDVSVLNIHDGTFTVKSTGGDTRLGGEDIDRVVADKVWQQVAQQGHPELQTDPRAIKRVMYAIEKAKRELSSVQEAEVIVEGLVAPSEGKKGYDLVYKLTRTEFETLNKNIFNRCLETVANVLKDASMQPSDIDDIVLVGGSTRIPKLQQMLVDYFGGKQLCKSLNPDEAVAYGAAVQGAILGNQRSTQGLLLLDVTPLSLGIELVGRVMAVVIPRNTPIPCVKSEIFTTDHDYQTEDKVVVYEGERPRSTDNHLLGQFDISGIYRAKKGEAKIQVTFELNSDGMLTVTATDLTTNSTANVQISRGARASEEDMQKMIEQAAIMRKKDDEMMKTSTMRADVESKLYELQQLIEDMGEDQKQEKNKKNAQEQHAKVTAWLAQHQTATMEQLAKQLSQLALFNRKIRQ